MTRDQITFDSDSTWTTGQLLFAATIAALAVIIFIAF